MLRNGGNMVTRLHHRHFWTCVPPFRPNLWQTGCQNCLSLNNSPDKPQQRGAHYVSSMHHQYVQRGLRCTNIHFYPWKCVRGLHACVCRTGANSFHPGIHLHNQKRPFATIWHKDAPNESQPKELEEPSLPQNRSQDVFREQAWKKPEGLDTGIKVYNSLTRKKEPLILPSGRIATWYACGPTVYDHAHIGHASSYLRFDIIRRILMDFFNIDVVMVMGITDIDDKIIEKSKQVNMDYQRLARFYEDNFFRDMKSMKVLPPTVRTRVTEHIPHVIQFIKRIMDNGYAYVHPTGSVYFDVQKYERYGQLYSLANEKIEFFTSRITDPGKRNPRDFVLWKAAKPGEPFWNSPWGQGRPGWHIECSTMASSIFGPSLDIHTGGDDLKFPHHENEIAQSEACFCSTQWTNYWLHTGFLHQKDEIVKMSKSLKNTIRVSELLEKYTANHFRMFCMLRSYRQPIEFSDESMHKAISLHRQWATFLTTAESYVKGQILCKPINDGFLLASLENTKETIEAALTDDFDTPKAVQALAELIRKTNIELAQTVSSEAECSVRSPGVVAAVKAYVDRIMKLFAVEVSPKKLRDSKAEQRFNTVVDSVVKFRSGVRNYCLNQSLSESLEVSHRHKKLLKSCDDVRDDLAVLGVQIKDHGKQSRWNHMETPLESEAPLEEKK